MCFLIEPIYCMTWIWTLHRAHNKLKNPIKEDNIWANVEGTRLASSMHSHAPPQRSVKIGRGYSDSVNVGSGTFIPCWDRFYHSCQNNPAYRSAGNGLGFRRGLTHAGYVV